MYVTAMFAAKMAYSDDYLFVSDKLEAVSVFALSVDGEVPELVHCFGAKGPRAMAVHRATGTLLIACQDDHSIRLLDIRPPPSEWKFSADPASHMALDEARGTLFVATINRKLCSSHCPWPWPWLTTTTGEPALPRRRRRRL
jgi:hypothetical protein